MDLNYPCGLEGKNILIVHVYIIFSSLILMTCLFEKNCRNAFCPSSGTICLSGLLIAIVRIVRTSVDSARREDAPGIVNVVLRCCVNALLSSIDFLNKFTINFAAITGEAYCTSARMTYELLKRNLLGGRGRKKECEAEGKKQRIKLIYKKK